MTILKYSLWIQGLSVCHSGQPFMSVCLSVHLSHTKCTFLSLSLSRSGRHKQEESLFEEMLQVSQAIVS